MKISISHDTVYYYEDLVRASIQYLRLTPQESLSWQLDLPRPATVHIDPFGNLLHVLTLDEPHDTIRIHASGQVEIDETCEAEGYTGSPLPFLRATALTKPNEALTKFALRSVGEHRDRAALGELMHALRDYMAYIPGSTHVATTAAEAFAGASGVCQDHSHAFLACIRRLGIPGRYVSGYLLTDDLGHLASHAWVEAWLNDAWYSFDITNRLMRPERHLKLAVGMDYLDACPVRGMRRGGGYEKMHAHVIVSPLEMQIQQQQ